MRLILLTLLFAFITSCTPKPPERYWCGGSDIYPAPAPGAFFGCGDVSGALFCDAGCLVSAWDGSPTTEFGDEVLRYALHMHENWVYKWRPAPPRKE